MSKPDGEEYGSEVPSEVPNANELPEDPDTND